MNDLSSATAPEPTAADYRVTRRVLIIVGAITALLGVFILLGPDDASIGVGGTVSWEIEEIGATWGYGLLLAGGVLLAGGLVLVARSRRLPKPAEQSATGWHDVIAHASVFLIVNSFVWMQDLAIGGGIDYAYWITVPWGVGLLLHIVAQASTDR